MGVVQGVTEFLPISSTAHLRIVPALAGWGDAGAAFTAVLQLGTLVAVRRLLPARPAEDVARGDHGGDRPVAAARAAGAHAGLPDRRDDAGRHRGLAFKHAIEGSLRSLWVISIALIVVALALLWIESAARHSRGFDDIGLRDAIIIGCAQALALVPGVSRSGITLVAAMALGLRRDAAARFSFLLGVPAIGAAGIFELPKILRSHDISGGALRDRAGRGRRCRATPASPGCSASCARAARSRSSSTASRWAWSCWRCWPPAGSCRSKVCAPRDTNGRYACAWVPSGRADRLFVRQQ